MHTDGENAAKRQRHIQDEVKKADRRHEAHHGKESGKAMQAGAREYPAPPLPPQHQEKPGSEQDLDPPPYCDAPYYIGSEKLLDKVALITGGDSGIGRAVAILFAREGADVAISYLDEHEDAQATKEKVEAEGRRCILIPGDVSSGDHCRAVVEATVRDLGGIDVLVNNAAFQVHAPRFEDLTPEHFDETVKTNLYGYFYMAQAAIAHMKPGSAIINTGSVTGTPYKIDQSAPNLNKYSATRRIARAIFMGSAPTHKEQNKGLDDRQINLGVVQPGERPAIFGDALRRLTNQAKFMHSDLGRYWYSMTPSLNRMAADRAGQLEDALVLMTIDQELAKYINSIGDRGHFDAVQVAPSSSSDVPDESGGVRLVVLGVAHPHSGREGSEALTEAKDILMQKSPHF